jgi:hypothetical protein
VSREDIVAVAARLFAVFLSFSTLQIFPVLMESYTPEIGVRWMVPQIILIFLGLTLSALCWFFPLLVARKLLPVMKEPRSEQTIDASIALSLGLTLMGMWFFANALINSVYWIVVLARTKQTYDTSFNWDYNTVASMYVTAAELVFAIWLLVGTADIKRALFRFRMGGFVPTK